MSGHDPLRLLEPGSEASPLLRETLEAGRAELPDQEQLLALASKLGVPLGPGGGPEGGGAPSGGSVAGGASALGAAKLVAAVLLGVSLIGGGGLALWGGLGGEELPPPPPGPQEPGTALSSTDRPDPEAPPELASGPAPTPAPEISEVDAASRPRPGPVPRTASSPRAAPRASEPDPAEELALLRRAQDALVRSPARSLLLAEEHGETFPRSPFAQEREVITIEAQVRLGRLQAARARAARFRGRWPRSSHNQRIERLVGGAPSSPDAATSD